MSLEHVETQCPYCGETIPLIVDPTAGASSYTEDCSVCCRPILLQIEASEDGPVSVSAQKE